MCFIIFFVSCICDGVKVKQPVMDSLEFAQAVVKESTDLEVLSMHGRSYPHACFEETPLSLDALCSELFNHATFLSKFRVLEIRDCAPGCIVSQEIFDQFFQCTSQHQLTMLKK